MEIEKLIGQIREQYIQTPPEGYSKNTIKKMSDSDLLDMHHFLNDEEDFDDEQNAFDFDWDVLCECCRAKLQKMMGR